MELRSDRLQLLLDVLEHGGFAKAARARQTSQSNISQAIHALETDVGAQLIDRAIRPLQLTEAGVVLARHAQIIRRDLEAAKNALSELSTDSGGTLALGAPDTLAAYVLPAMVKRFAELHPSVALTLENRPSTVIAEKCAARELDVGMVSLPLPRGQAAAVQALIQVPLFEQREVVIVPPGHPLSVQKQMSVTTLFEQEQLILLEPNTASRQWLERAVTTKRKPRSTDVGSVEVAKRLVEAKLGISVVPELAAQRELTEGRLIAVRLTGGERRSVAVVLRKQAPKAARLFTEVAKRMTARSAT